MSRPWTTHDLEQFQDHELDAASRAQLSDALRSDPGLRERLNRIQRADALASTALLARDDVSHPNAGVARRAAVRLGAAAALITAALGAWRLFSPDGASPSEPSIVLNPPAAPAPAAPAHYQPIRVAFELPHHAPSAPRRSTPPHDMRRQTGNSEPAAFLAALNRALDEQNPDAAIDLLDGADDEERAIGLTRVAELLRSAATAQRLLDRLPADAQVELCRAMARDGKFRPAAFSRLRRLADDPAAQPLVARALSEMRSDPAMRSQLRAYRMLEPDAPGS